ncbi:MAG TPA: NAD(P)/FAD-dependent oxidoreductase [Solirubrobacterales bacterium]|nr:NAD(P)/FAD-dependent oxidoreductase [Solirubrobacterales bacterium]
MRTTADTQPEVEVAIVGAGFSGIGTAIELDRAGFRDWALIEEGSGVGGAWYWNTYPGIGVDIPSFSYQFSFEQRSDWSRVYAKGEELRGYAEDCVDRYGLRSRIRFDSKVVSASYDEEGHFWRLDIAEGPALSARHLVGATGILSQPKPLDIPGLDDFAGQVMHTARWDHDVDLAGRRVAIVGTGASAVQVIPAIAPRVERLTVLQRTPIWCLPKPDGPIRPGMRRILERVPGAGRVARALSQAYVELIFPIAAHYPRPLRLASIGERQALKGLRSQVRDPVVREKLTPSYGLGCKRVSFSNEYLPTFNRDNVYLETSPIERFTAGSVRTAEAEHEIDVLILATGFKVFEQGNFPPYPVAGRGGVDLGEWWGENRFQAYEGVSVPGFPNLFMILGPYGYNGSSYFTLIEHQARHIVRCLTRARETGTTEIEVTAEANRRYWESMLGRRDRQVFFSGTCGTANSYYFDAHGDAPFRPASTLEAAWRSGHFLLADYRFTRPRRQPRVPLADEAGG